MQYLIPGLSAFLVPLILVIILIPQIRSVAFKRNFIARPNHRSVHDGHVPNVGGSAIFLSVFFTSLIILDWTVNPVWQYIFAGAFVLAVVSLRDDVLEIRPREKFISQFATATIVLLGTGWDATSLFNLLGIQEVPQLINTGTAILLFVLLINAYNLIDGVDGLASFMVICAHGIFLVIWGGWGGAFESLPLFSLMITGAYCGFLPFNYSIQRKTFMGDVGSSFAGFSVSVLFFYSVNNHATHDISPLLAFGLLFIPVIDVLRLFVLRILQGRSPFSADNQHFHHVLLEYRVPHQWIAPIIALIQILSFFIIKSITEYSSLPFIYTILYTIMIAGVITIAMWQKKKKSLSSSSGRPSVGFEEVIEKSSSTPTSVK